MENKYYTPEIEEFYVGFEYQIQHTDYPNEWQTHEFILDDFDWAMLDEKHMNAFRVKYLDREDIESLGFDKLSKDKYFLEYGILIPGADYYWHPYGNWKYRITTPDKDFPNSFIIEGRNPSNAGTFRKFVGTIKNKSELKKLMKQLGIYEL